MRLLLCIIACYIILVAGIPKVASSFWTYKTWKVFQPKPTQPTHHLCCSVWSLLIFYLNHSKRILQLSYFIVSSNHVWRHNLPASSTCVCMCVCVWSSFLLWSCHILLISIYLFVCCTCFLIICLPFHSEHELNYKQFWSVVRF